MAERLAYVIKSFDTGWHVYEQLDESPEPEKKEYLFISEYSLPVNSPASDWYIATFHSAEHSGLDINLNRAPWGDVELGMPVYAVANGVVVFAGMAAGKSWGNLVITMGYNGVELEFWRYAHLRDVFVETGMILDDGTPIGYIGKGYNDRYAAHLHIDCWIDRMIAPESWLDRRIIWLDPLGIWPKWEWGTR